MKTLYPGLWAAFVLVIAAAGGCGTKPFAFIRADHPKAKDHFLYDVEVYYGGDELPEGVEVMEHIKETAAHTDCETAAVMAIVKMQKKARASGGDALVNLKHVAKGEKGKKEGGKSFTCTRRSSLEEGSGDVTLKVWEVTWEGDVASMGHEIGEEPLEESDGFTGLPAEEGEGEGAWTAKKEKKKPPKKKGKGGKKGKKGKKAKGTGASGPGEADMVIDPSETNDTDLQLDTGEDIY